jgi:membrane protease YdiL (CAAX protease family)
VRQVGYLVGIVIVIAFASHMAFQPERAGTPAVFVWMGVANVALAIVGCVRAWQDGVLKQWFRVKAGDFTIAFVSAAVLFGGSFAFSKSLKLPQVMWLARLYEQLGDAAELRKHVTWVVIAIVVTAVAEELVWRGLVVSLLEEKIGSRRAWLYSAVLYAVAHVPTIWALKDINAGPNPMLVIAALSCGIVWGFMARRFERLVPGMISHVLFDWTIMMMFRLWGPSV